MLLVSKQKLAAKKFVENWTGRGYEKGETQRFWLELLHNIFGIDNPMAMMEFEIPVKTIYKEKGSDFIDAYITSTKVLIEQKGSKVDLSAKARQSDGMELTPYQQARRYAAGLPLSMAPRWIVACNFETFEVHDMERPTAEPEVIRLDNLEKEYHRLSFLVDDSSVHLKKELEVSIQAGEIVGVLYEKLLAQYRNPDDPESQKALNKLCVRLVFCLYAEDAGIFGSKNMFHDYMDQFSAADFREKLIKLFRILDQKPEDRDPYEDEKLLAFPYVNGGMFAGDIEIPRINDEIRTLILQRASDDFDWSMISPTIFGAVFESTLNPETRRAGGMHYTSIENIHKVIDPLFLDDLKAELAEIKTIGIAKTRRDRAYAFQDKLAGLKFFDPACGSGNFLTESYTSLRRLENETLRIIYGGDRVLGELNYPIKVSIYQFYGIEINDFACSVAQTALWIAESQMMQETDEIVGLTLDPLPLKTYTNIHEGNALRMDWNEVVPAGELNYIMGNPPFVGYSLQTESQKQDILDLMVDENGKQLKAAGKVDYVAGWYYKAAAYMQNGNIQAALVSTNSIVQGEQVAGIWGPLIERYGIIINFAYKTFRWDSEANAKAHVHCVIIGFSNRASSKRKQIFDGENVLTATHINPYLVDAADVLIGSRSKPLCDVPEMRSGGKPVEGGFLIFTDEDKDDFLRQEPAAAPYFRPFMGSDDYINAHPRWCLWLLNVSPKELRQMPKVMERVESVRSFRLASVKAATREMADQPARFMEIKQPSSDYIMIPATSSEKREYIPMGFLSKDVIASNAASFVPDATLYHLGILTSSVHMAWMRVVCGRLEMRYRYSVNIVYNNYPWPQPTYAQIEKISQTAQAILDARELYLESSLADLYDEIAMPIELRKAHRANDAAVLEAYGFPKDSSESEIVARLFKLYQKLTAK
jgi:type I restriction-modification system DNA methylase subunit